MSVAAACATCTQRERFVGNERQMTRDAYVTFSVPFSYSGHTGCPDCGTEWVYTRCAWCKAHLTATIEVNDGASAIGALVLAAERHLAREHARGEVTAAPA